MIYVQASHPAKNDRRGQTILHDAILYAPDQLNDFAIRYQSAAFERDDCGRLNCSVTRPY